MLLLQSGPAGRHRLANSYIGNDSMHRELHLDVNGHKVCPVRRSATAVAAALVCPFIGLAVRPSGTCNNHTVDPPRTAHQSCNMNCRLFAHCR